jgi:cell division protein FtsW
MAQDKSVKDYKITDIDQLLEPGTSAIPERAKIHTDLNPQNVNIPMLLMVFFMLVFGLVVLYSVSVSDAYGLCHDSALFL